MEGSLGVPGAGQRWIETDDRLVDALHPDCAREPDGKAGNGRTLPLAGALERRRCDWSHAAGPAIPNHLGLARLQPADERVGINLHRPAESARIEADASAETGTPLRSASKIWRMCERAIARAAQPEQPAFLC